LIASSIRGVEGSEGQTWPADAAQGLRKRPNPITTIDRVVARNIELFENMFQ